MIGDNGRGFDPDAPTERHGLHSIKGRVAKWKGRFSIDSSPGKGTLINVGLPIKTGFSLRKS
jgi:signal transduction histidine kinase